MDREVRGGGVAGNGGLNSVHCCGGRADRGRSNGTWLGSLRRWCRITRHDWLGGHLRRPMMSHLWEGHAWKGTLCR